VDMERMRKRSEAFDDLLSAIPAKFYFQKKEDDTNNKATKQKKGQKAEMQRKENTKKGKLARLNPANSMTILDVQAGKAPAKASGPVPIAELKERLKAEIAELGKNRQDSGGSGSNQRKRKKSKEEDDEDDGEQKPKRERKRRPAADDDDEDDDADQDDQGSEQDGDSDEGAGEAESDEDGDNIQFGRIIEKSTSAGGFKKKKWKLSKEQQLEKALKDQERLDNADDDTKSRHDFERAMLKAEGVKMKDDPKLLKKAIKRDEKEKKRSQGKWKDRSDKVTLEKKDKQDKRKQNIKEWHAGRKTKGAKGKTPAKAKDKGGKSPLRPGFEGKKKGFLNPSKSKK